MSLKKIKKLLYTLEAVSPLLESVSLALKTYRRGKLTLLSCRLGYITDAGVPQLVPVADEKTAKQIFIHNDDAEREFSEFGSLGHWSGIKPRTTPTIPKLPTRPLPTLHQQQCKARHSNELNLYYRLLEAYTRLCPYSLLQQTCPLGMACPLFHICQSFAENDLCALEDCDNIHMRYSCKWFIESGICEWPDNRYHWEVCQHEGFGTGPEERERDWDSREAHAALRDAHVMGRF